MAALAGFAVVMDMLHITFRDWISPPAQRSYGPGRERSVSNVAGTCTSDMLAVWQRWPQLVVRRKVGLRRIGQSLGRTFVSQ